MRVALTMAVIALAAGAADAADPIADFYTGKQIKIYIRADPGGNYDLYSRLVGRHISKHIPGNPSVLPINMPGGGGLKALNYVANVAPKDGTILTIVTQTLPMEQALGSSKELEADLRKLNWIGNMTANSMFMLTSAQSPIKKLDDAKSKEAPIAITGEGSVGGQFVTLMNNTMGTKFKLIKGYNSGPAMGLAMERGEVDGRLTSNPAPLIAAAKTANQAPFNYVIQGGVRKEKGFEEVPLLNDMARNPDEKQVFEYFSKVLSLSRPMTTSADVPPERVAVLRKAFDAMMSDPAFLEEGRREGLELEGMGGAELQKIVTDIVNVSPDVLAKVQKAIQ